VTFPARLTATCSQPTGGSCEVTVAGPVDQRTGMVMNIVELKRVVRGELEREPSSPALLADLLRPLLPAAVQLISVKLSTNGSNREWTNLMNAVLITRVYDFPAGHRLWLNDSSEAENRELFGKCVNPHGHNFGLEVTVLVAHESPSEPLIEESVLDTLVEREVVDRYDHQFLNDHEDFAGLVPTCETMCRIFFERVERALCETQPRVKLHHLGLRETPRNFFEYFGD